MKGYMQSREEFSRSSLDTRPSRTGSLGVMTPGCATVMEKSHVYAVIPQGLVISVRCKNISSAKSQRVCRSYANKRFRLW